MIQINRHTNPFVLMDIAFIL